MFKETVVTLLTAVGKIPDMFRAARSGSLVEYTKMTRVEPVVLVGTDAVAIPYIEDVMHSITSIIAGYYLQAVALSVNIGKVDVVRLLERLNPSRDPAEVAGMVIGDVMMDMQSFGLRLPFPNEPKMSLEATVDDDGKIQQNATFGRDTRLTAQNVTNLSVGMLLEVNIESDGSHGTIPVSVRLIVSATNNDSLVHIMSSAEKDISVKERYHAWRAGQLEFIRDLILCNDLVDDHRRTLMNDKSGTYARILERRNKNRLAAFISGEPSVAQASTVIVMTAQTASALESQIGGPLTNYKVRQRIFENTYLMLMVVIDPRWDTVTFYHRGIANGSELSAKALKSAGGKNGPDVAEILKAYQMGHAPTF